MIKIVNIKQMPLPDFENWAIVRSFNGKAGVQWHPELSPSSNLFGWYLKLKKNGEWDESAFLSSYVPTFLKEIAGNPTAKEALNTIYFADKEGRNIALGCFCENEATCHRSIVAGLLQGVGCNVRATDDYSHYYAAYKIICSKPKDVYENETTEGFRGNYWFLSNFYPSPIIIGDYTFTCSEAAFQAQKCLDPSSMGCFEGIDGKDAKSLGRRVAIRKDWDKIRVPIMEEILRIKFSNPTLSAKLKATGNVKLIEYNTWGDKFWGVSYGEGRNELGKLLMKIRAEL